MSSADAFRNAASRMTPHAPLPAVTPTPVVLGGVLRSDSPFLDALPMDHVPMDPVPMDHVPMDYVPMGHMPMDHVPTSTAPTDAMPMDVVPLGVFPLDAPAPADGMLFLPFQPVAPAALGATSAEPPAPAAPFDPEAVARARARAACAAERVEATVMSDDGVAEHVCDVTSWLAGATARELDALLEAGWTGDEAAEVADALAEDDPEVADVLRHARRADAGVVVEIDGRAALAWLARHRPAVADRLAEATDEVPDEAFDED